VSRTVLLLELAAVCAIYLHSERSRSGSKGKHPGDYVVMCGPKGYGFSGVLVINRVSIWPFWS